MSTGKAPRPGVASLRERNRARARAEIVDAALALFTARGFERVTVDDIADAAGVSRRTFFRYFDSKEDVALPYEQERLDHFRAVLASRPADEPALDTVRNTLLAMADDLQAEQDRLQARLRVMASSPSVRARSLEHLDAWEDILRTVFAERLGSDPERGLAPRVLAAASTATVRAAVDTWLAADFTPDLLDLVLEAFDLLVADLHLGFPPGTS